MKYKLSEVMDLIGGGTPKTSKLEYWNGDIPWLSVKDFNNGFRYVYETEKSITQLGLENSSTKLLQKGDIIISARGTVGEIATIPFPMAFNQSCYGLRAKSGIVTSDYLYYLIKLFGNCIHTPLVIQARNISPSSNWKDIISSALGLSSNWSEDEIWQAMISMVNRHRFSSAYIDSNIKIVPKILLIVDGIDECAPYEIWNDRIKEAGIITKRYQQIRFCFTSRPFVFPKKLSGVTTKRLGSAGDVPTHTLFERYMEAYNINAQNYGWLKFALTTPLSLKVFCELNEGKTVEYTKNTDVSLTNLLRSKIDLIENEFAKEEKISIKNQYILRAILELSNLFLKSKSIEYSDVISYLISNLGTTQQQCERVLQYLENYGILSSFCKHGEGLNPDLHFYIPGIQGYFDYAMALKLLESYDHPQNIDFEQCSAIENEALYALSVMAMQNHNYLITRNKTIRLLRQPDRWMLTKPGQAERINPFPTRVQGKAMGCRRDFALK